MANLYRGTVRKITAYGAYVEIAALGQGIQFGPLMLTEHQVELGDLVLVGQVGAVREDLAILGPLVNSHTPAGLDDLTDVVLGTPPNDGDVLTYDAGTETWISAAPAGGGGALDDLSDVTITSPATGHVLQYDGTGWVNAASLHLVGAAAADDLLTGKVAGDANSRFIVNADGKLEWGDGTNPADVALYRSAANQLSIGSSTALVTGTIQSWGNVNSFTSLSVQGFLESQPSFIVTKADGIKLGPGGATAPDIKLSRASAGVLRTDSTIVHIPSTFGLAFATAQPTDVENQWEVWTDGYQTWGDGGSSPPDTNLYRSAPQTLETNSSFVIGGNLLVTGYSGPCDVQKFTTTGADTWNMPSPAPRRVLVEVIGAGGGGAGSAAAASAQHSEGSGGGGGGYAATWFDGTDLASSESLSVGAGGTGGGVGANGNDGGTSSFSSGGTLVSASGGEKGFVATSTATTRGLRGGAGGNTLTGDFAIAGSPGHTCGGGGNLGWAGSGGTGGGPWGGGGGVAPASSSNGQSLGGNTGKSYGGGGSGAMSTSTGAGATGGAGANGVVVVTCFW